MLGGASVRILRKGVLRERDVDGKKGVTNKINFFLGRNISRLGAHQSQRPGAVNVP